MACLRCGKQQRWADDPRFCSGSCRERFYGEAAAAPRGPPTPRQGIRGPLAAGQPDALAGWGKQTGLDVVEYQGPESAKIYVDHIMRSPFGAGHGIGLRAAHSDYAPEYPAIQRTPLQERLRARLAKWIAPSFKTNQQARADAYARARVDLLDAWAPQFAVAEAVQARLHAAVPEHERLAFDAEERYQEGRRRC